jgi:hypothetical protein
MIPLPVGKWKMALVSLLCLSVCAAACAPAGVETRAPAPLATFTRAAPALTAAPAAAAQDPAAVVTVTVEPVVPAQTETPGPTPALSQDSATAITAVSGPLSVNITSPQDEAVVQAAQVDLIGEADPETVISIDDQFIVVGQERKFSVSLTLDEGPNVIEITASDPAGNEGTTYLTIIYDPQP